MASTYTTNLGIEKIADGEQSETWGDTTNTNFDLIDQGINGIISITLASAGNSGSPNDLPITDGTVSNGRNKFIEFVDGGDLGATAYVQLTPNDAEKLVFIRNSLSASRSLIVFQGTYNASNDFEVPNGHDVVLKFDGAGAGATVTQVFNNLSVDGLTFDGDVTGTGNLSFTGNVTASATSTETRFFDIGVGRTGNGASYADFVGDTTYSDYGLRVIRAGGGENTSSSLIHRGTGALNVQATDAGSINLKTSNLDRLQVESTGTVVFKNGIQETAYNLTGTDLDPDNGTIQYKTLAANTTLTESIEEGEAITLMIDDGSAYTLTFPTITFVNNGGTAPTLATTGYTVFAIWKVSTTLYGALVGDGS